MSEGISNSNSFGSNIQYSFLLGKKNSEGKFEKFELYQTNSNIKKLALLIGLSFLAGKSGFHVVAQGGIAEVAYGGFGEATSPSKQQEENSKIPYRLNLLTTYVAHQRLGIMTKGQTWIENLIEKSKFFENLKGEERKKFINLLGENPSCLDFIEKLATRKSDYSAFFKDIENAESLIRITENLNYLCTKPKSPDLDYKRADAALKIVGGITDGADRASIIKVLNYCDLDTLSFIASHASELFGGITAPIILLLNQCHNHTLSCIANNASELFGPITDRAGRASIIAALDCCNKNIISCIAKNASMLFDGITDAKGRTFVIHILSEYSTDEIPTIIESLTKYLIQLPDEEKKQLSTEQQYSNLKRKILEHQLQILKNQPNSEIARKSAQLILENASEFDLSYESPAFIAATTSLIETSQIDDRKNPYKV